MNFVRTYLTCLYNICISIIKLIAEHLFCNILFKIIEFNNINHKTLIQVNGKIVDKF